MLRTSSRNGIGLEELKSPDFCEDGKQKKRNLRDPIVLSCRHCGAAFLTSGNGQKYCTTSCTQAAGRARNRTWLREYSREYYHKNKTRLLGQRQHYACNSKEARSRRSREQNYGKGASDHFKKQIELQKGLCAVCGGPMGKPNLDHNHETAQLRGAVCHGCNTGLCYLERPGFLKKGLDYLESWGRYDGV